jgi:hypothetical protein
LGLQMAILAVFGVKGEDGRNEQTPPQSNPSSQSLT